MKRPVPRTRHVTDLLLRAWPMREGACKASPHSTLSLLSLPLFSSVSLPSDQLIPRSSACTASTLGCHARSLAIARLPRVELARLKNSRNLTFAEKFETNLETGNLRISVSSCLKIWECFEIGAWGDFRCFFFCLKFKDSGIWKLDVFQVWKYWSGGFELLIIREFENLDIPRRGDLKACKFGKFRHSRALIQKLENWKIRMWNFRVWRFGSSKIWRFGSWEIGKFRYPKEFENSKASKFGYSEDWKI